MYKTRGSGHPAPPSSPSSLFDMPGTFTHVFDTTLFKGTITVNTGLFIDGQWVDSANKETIEWVVNLVNYAAVT